jgi:carboxymethylenebutenolidase
VPDLTFSGSSRDLGVYLARPIGEGPWPGVVVIHDAVGLSDDIREQADRLAAAGYLAFAPDLYSRARLRCVLAMLSAYRTGDGEVYDNIEAARRWLAERDDCTGRIGVIGFCMGGGFALMAAVRSDFDAASVNYGEVPKDAATRLVGACPIVASFGARDLTLPGRAARLERALDELGITHDVKEYPDAGHSFLNRPNAGPLLGTVLTVTRFNHHHPSAEDAWRRILSFFGQHLHPADESAPSDRTSAQ